MRGESGQFGRDSVFEQAKVLVTGGVGFVGSHLCKRLHTAGAQITVLDRESPTRGTLFSVMGLNDSCNVLTMPAESREASAAVASLGPDYVFNLAAIPYAPYTSEHRDETYISNVVATKNIATSVRSNPVFVHASSACVFGATTESPLKVTDQPNEGQHYYTESKQLAERSLRLVGAERDLDAVVCRFGNIYGPGDRILGRIIPSLCRQLVTHPARKSLVLRRSSGASVFEFLHVHDAVEALILAAVASERPEIAWQFSGGPASRASVSQVAGIVSRCHDGNSRRVEFRPSGEAEKTVKKYLDDSCSRQNVGFSPSIDLQSGIHSTLDWYGRFLDDLTPSRLSLTGELSLK